MKSIAVVLLWMSTATSLHGQDLVVSLSPFSPPARTVLANSIPLKRGLGILRFYAPGAQAQLDGISITTSGTASFIQDLQPGSSIEIWRDNGSGTFQMDIDKFLGGNAVASPKTTISFPSPLTVAAGAYVDLWVAVEFPLVEQGVFSRTFMVSIAIAGDVAAPGATVMLGTPLPQTEPVTFLARRGTGRDFVDDCAASPNYRSSMALLGVVTIGVILGAHGRWRKLGAISKAVQRR
jgi:hypothetical protein